MASLDLHPADCRFPSACLLHALCAVGSMYTADIPATPVHTSGIFPCAYNSDQRTAYPSLLYFFFFSQMRSSRVVGGGRRHDRTHLRSSKPSSRRMLWKICLTLAQICSRYCKVRIRLLSLVLKLMIGVTAIILLSWFYRGQGRQADQPFFAVDNLMIFLRSDGRRYVSRC